VRTERAGDSFYRCYAGSDADCAASDACTRYGRCAVAEDGSCVAPGDVESRRCATSVECTVWGGCHPREGFCEPLSEDDCRRSLECITQGRCTYDASSHGCFATDPADCARSTGCTLEGICTLESLPVLGHTYCGVGRNGHCEGTVACARDGRCAVRPLDACSEGCRIFYCGRPESISAPAPCTEMHGSALLVCAPDGRCMANAEGVCEHLP
jgi:hypothetical protein